MIGEIPIDISSTQSGDVHASDVPEEIQSLTRGVARTEPPPTPLIVVEGRLLVVYTGMGGSDPGFHWAVEWTCHLATDTPSDVDRSHESLDSLVTVGFADENMNSDDPNSAF